MLMVRVLCPAAGMTPVFANMTQDTPAEYRCCKCGNTGHQKYEARGRTVGGLVIEDAATTAKRKKFKKGGKSKGKKKGGKAEAKG